MAYSKPSDIPRWADTSTNIAEPSSGKKDEGWLVNEIPPSSYENWLKNIIGNWFKWLNERMKDSGGDPNLFALIDPGNQSFVTLSDNVDITSYTDLEIDADPILLMEDDCVIRPNNSTNTCALGSATYTFDSAYIENINSSSVTVNASAGDAMTVVTSATSSSAIVASAAGNQSIGVETSGNKYGIRGVGTGTFGVGVNAQGASTAASLNLQPRSGNPTNLSAGDMWFNATDSKLYYYNGSATKEIATV
jgi:hypothetical protein